MGYLELKFSSLGSLNAWLLIYIVNDYTGVTGFGVYQYLFACCIPVFLYFVLVYMSFLILYYLGTAQLNWANLSSVIPVLIIWPPELVVTIAPDMSVSVLATKQDWLGRMICTIHIDRSLHAGHSSMYMWRPETTDVQHSAGYMYVFILYGMQTYIVQSVYFIYILLLKWCML